MSRTRMIGAVGAAAALTVTALATAEPAVAGTDPQHAADGTTQAPRPNAARPMAAYYGTDKIHIGVQLADGTYDTSNPPDLTGAEFQIVETGPSAPDPNTTTCTLTAKPTGQGVYPGDEDYPYYCDFDPTDAQYFTYYIGDGDQVAISQVSAPDGVLPDPATKSPDFCDTALCLAYTAPVRFTDRGLKPVAANLAKVVNHGKAQAIDVVAQSQTAGLTPTLAITTKPAHGSALVRSGKIVYTPLSTFGGPDVFTYTLTTAQGSSLGTVHMSVQVPPLARRDTASTKGSKTKHGKKVTVAVLANDLARGGGKLAGLAVLRPPKHGSARVAKSKIAYTPAKGFHGKDVLTYVVKNKYGKAKAKLAITVRKP